MTTFQIHRTIKFAACTGASLFALSILSVSPAKADDCLLDRDNDGVVDAATDNDGGANSNNDDSSTACGVGANTGTAAFATAIGSNSNATADRTVAVGRLADATAADATALGHNADATGASSLAVGQSAISSALNAVAVGQSAQASAESAVALGQSSAASATGAVALGSDATSSQAGGIAIGQNANASGPSTTNTLFASVAVGVNTTAVDNATAIGNNAIARFSGTATPLVSGINSAVAIGANAVAVGSNTIAIGTTARAGTGFALNSPGADVLAGSNITVVGGRAEANANNATAWERIPMFPEQAAQQLARPVRQRQISPPQSAITHARLIS